jgi:hypothetical protein
LRRSKACHNDPSLASARPLQQGPELKLKAVNGLRFA